MVCLCAEGHFKYKVSAAQGSCQEGNGEATYRRQKDARMLRALLLQNAQTSIVEQWAGETPRSLARLGTIDLVVYCTSREG